MPSRLSAAFLTTVLAFATLLTACADEDLPLPLEVYEGGRAEVLARADSGRALLIEHEPFDSVMTQPMVMELRLDDPRTAQGVQPGDKIQFDLVLGQRYHLHNVEKLPATTRLNLTADSSAGSAAPSDSAATDS